MLLYSCQRVVSLSQGEVDLGMQGEEHWNPWSPLDIHLGGVEEVRIDSGVDGRLVQGGSTPLYDDFA